VGLVYDLRRLRGVTTTRPRVVGVLQMVSEQTLMVSQTSMSSVEKDIVAYGSGMWVHTHDA
jgi:hypothetical protein